MAVNHINRGAGTGYTTVAPKLSNGDPYAGALAGSIAGSALSSVVGFMTGGVSRAGGLLGAGSGLGGGSDLAQFESLLNQQIEAQTTMQIYSSRSNIVKTEHETAMNAIRNMKA